MTSQTKSGISGIGILVFRGFALTALLAALIWPAILNSGPYFYPDTLEYLHGGDSVTGRLESVVQSLFRGFRTPSGKEDYLPQPAQGDISSHTPTSNSLPPKKTILRIFGRSKYYGTLLSIGKTGDKFWIAMLLQAVAVVAAIAFLFRTLDKPAWPSVLLIGFLICVFSDAPFFVSFLVPDLFVGIMILIIAAVIALGRGLRAGETVTAFLLILLGLLFHDSAVLIAFPLITLALAWNLVRRSQLIWLNYGVLALTLALGIVGQGLLLFRAKQIGETRVRIPFLSARLIADGPGTRFLRETCPGSAFVLCRYVDRFPMPPLVFLWATSNEGGIWFPTAGDSEELTLIKKRISDQDLSFAIAVFRRFPMSVLSHSLENSARQLFMFGVNEFSYSDGTKSYLDSSLPKDDLAALHRSPAYKQEVPVTLFSYLNYGFVILALSYLVLIQFATGYRASIDRELWKLLLWTAVGIVLNAVVCGSISDPNPRFEARVIWLLPLLALVIGCSARLSSFDRKHRAQGLVDDSYHSKARTIG